MTRSTATPISRGLALLLAAHAAFPRGAGDRNRIQAMHDLLSNAIACKVQFNVDDGPQIKAAGIGIQTSVGVFRPLDDVWYYRAAIAGGTYARMWEAHHGVKPFLVPEAWRGEGSREVPLQRQRVAPGLAILLPDDDREPGLQLHGGSAVWWCTKVDFDSDRVHLCRYPGSFMRNPRNAFDANARKPARRKAISRIQWNEFVKTIAVQRPAKAA